MWNGLSARLAGRLVVLEPLRAEHEVDVFQAAQDMDWTWMPVDASAGRQTFQAWLADALERTLAGGEGIFRKHMVVQRGELRDSAWYAITNDEWPAVRANLERRLASPFGGQRSRT